MMKNLKSMILFLIFFFCLISLSVCAGEKTSTQYEWLIPPKYEMARGFSEGLWSVQKNGLWGFVDSTDNVVVDFQYLKTTLYQDGMAFVQTSADLWGLIDKQGKYLIKPKFNLDPYSLYSGEFRISDLICFQSGDKYGFLNLSGDIQIPPIYTEAQNFSEDLAVVKSGDFMGCVDTQGSWVIPPCYKKIFSFYRGYATFKSDNGMYGLINSNGDVVLEPVYEFLFRNVEGLTGVYVDGKCGFMDDTFHFVVKPQYSTFKWGPVYIGGLVFVEDRKTYEGFALDKEGNIAFTFPSWSLQPKILTDVKGYYVMQVGPNLSGREILLNNEGKIVLDEPDFKMLLPSKEGIVQILQGKLCGLIVLTHFSE
jgi:hypothetical protein